MHIAFLVEYLGPRGGTEEYIRALGDRLMSRGHKVDLLYENRTDAAGADWRKFINRVTSIQIPAQSTSRDRQDWLKRYLDSEGPDLLYVHNISFASDVVAAAFQRVPVARYIHDFRPVCLRTSKVFPISRQNCTRTLGATCLLHGCSIGPAKGGPLPVSWNNFTSKRAERRACLSMDRVMVASAFMRDLLVQNGFSSERVTVLPYFCPTEPPRTPPPFISGTRLLFVGQVQKFKGLSVLLAALRMLPEPVTLDVAGDGPWSKRCQALVKRWGLGNRVTFHGWTDRQQLAALMSQIQVVVVPSIWNEPFGIVGLEAMAHARPVVAFDVGGIAQWLDDGETGLLVKEKDPHHLARNINALCRNPKLAESMGVRGYQRIREHFSADGHLDSLLAAFGALVDERSGAPA